MHAPIHDAGRRRWFKTSALLAATAATSGLMAFEPLLAAPPRMPIPSSPEADDSLYMIGPRDGYSPYIGSLVSMMNYNRSTIIKLTASMTMEQLDHLHDPQSNTIGALLMHLAVVDKVYYMNCFEKNREFTDEEKKFWEPALDLDEKGRAEIKGKDLAYYVDLMTTTRAQTLEALKTKDDKWLLAVDYLFSKDQKFNNYWKWFHVCEHESHHRGQISWLKKRLPGMKDVKD
ncbi:MAG: DinB family protein [Bacteroidota bacterium]|nr:DinB family protein [Bacteroidota bacterium]